MDMNWMIFSTLAGVFWAAADILMRTVSGKMGTSWETLVLVTGMFLTTLLGAFWFDRTQAPALTHFFRTASPLWILLFAGALNAVGYFFFFRFFSSGGNLSQGFPFMTTILALGAVIGGVVFFRDALSPRIVLGIVTAIVSLYLLR